MRSMTGKFETMMKLIIALVVTMVTIMENTTANSMANNTRAAAIMKAVRITTTTNSTMTRARADILIMPKTAAVVDVEIPRKTRKVSAISP